VRVPFATHIQPLAVAAALIAWLKCSASSAQTKHPASSVLRALYLDGRLHDGRLPYFPRIEALMKANRRDDIND
jgi:hypothetical protein